MTFDIVFRAEARQEAIDVARYIAMHSDRDTALRWYKGLEEVVAGLTDMPGRFPYARENDQFSDVELRQIIYESHRIVFTVRGDVVHILHIRHNAQRGVKEL